MNTKEKLDKELFKILDKRTQKVYSKFKKYYIGDPKAFVNKISRDYESHGKFPDVHGSTLAIAFVMKKLFDLLFRSLLYPLLSTN